MKLRFAQEKERKKGLKQDDLRKIYPSETKNANEEKHARKNL